MDNPQPISKAIEAIWKIEAPRLIAALARSTRDLGAAEELAQEAFLAALEQWPRDGTPQSPAAWLMATAKHKAIDRARRERRLSSIRAELASAPPAQTDPATPQSTLDDPVPDDLLRLIFATCHPALATEARAALTLKLLCSLSTREIARAFLAPEPTIAQRIVRAKRTLAELTDSFEMPAADDLPERVQSVLEVVYLLFSEGYAATVGDDWMADRNSKRMTSAEAVVIDREVAVRRGAPIRQAAPGGRCSPRNACSRAVRRALGPWSGRLGNERAYSLALAAGEGRARRREGRAAQAKSSCSRERAGAGRGGSVGSPRCARILRTTTGSVSCAMRRRGPPQCGQVRRGCDTRRPRPTGNAYPAAKWAHCIGRCR